MRKPYYSKARGYWVIGTIDANGRRSRIRMGDTKREAFEAWQRMLEERTEVPGARTGSTQKITRSLLEVADRFLSACHREVELGELSTGSFGHYQRYIGLFCKFHIDLAVDDLRAFHVTDWLARFPSWGPASQRHAIGSVKRMITWGVAQGLVDRNWLVELRRPSARRRSTLIETSAHRKLIESVGTGIAASKADRHFRLVLAALRHSGGRPQDVARVQIEHLDLVRNQWVLPEHKTKRYTNRPRIVYLDPCLRTITLLAKGSRPSGPLFRNSLGQPLTVNAIRCRMRSLRRKNLLPAGAVAYSYRHTYITDALANGVDIASVAELTGTSIQMIQRHYGHLNQRADHLRNVAARAVRVE